MAEGALPPPRSCQTRSAAETEAHGARTGELLLPGDVVFVEGELGAGKTTWIRGACRALGVRVRVRSPTFTLAHRYLAGIPISHLDLYRLEGAGPEPGLLDEYLDPAGICFIEWPQHVGPLVQPTIRIGLRSSREQTREISLESARWR